MRVKLLMSIILCLGIFFASGELLSLSLKRLQSNVFQQATKSTIQARELASMNKEVSPYTPKKCGEIKHTDGTILTVCLVTFNGTTGGFYDSAKELMVIGSFSQYTLIHEITHATTLHYYKKGYTDMTAAETQEKMAYNAENLLMQINAFKEDMNITPDLSDEKKLKLGIPLTVKTIANTKVSKVRVELAKAN